MFAAIDMDTLPRVETMGQIRQPMGWSNANFQIERNMLILVRDGDMCFEVNQERFPLERDDFLLIPQGNSYRVSSSGSCQYVFIHFSTGEPLRVVTEDNFETESAFMIETLRSEKGTHPYSLPTGGRTCVLYVPYTGHFEGEQERIWTIFTECDMYRYEMTPNHKLRIDLRFAEMLSLLDAGERHTSPSAYPATLSQILMYIHGHYMEPLTLSGVAEKFGLSRQYVMRLFQNHIHLTVTQYITRLKLEHGRELLRYSTLRVSEVSEILGFDNAYYFCRLFKQRYGMTPTEFIRRETGSEQWGV